MSISKSFQALDDLATSRSSLICAPELELQGTCDENDQATCNDASCDTWDVIGRVLGSEDSRADNATNTTGANEGRRGKSSLPVRSISTRVCKVWLRKDLPLATDIVRLEGENAGNIGVGSGHSQKDAEVTCTDILREAEQRQANHAHNAIADDERSTEMILVTQHCTSVHPNGGEDVWWSDKALRCSNAKSHAIFQDDRQEISDSVRDCGGQPKERGEPPDLQVRGAFHVVLKTERYCDGVVSILFDASDDEFGFLLIQKRQGKRLCSVRSLLWEIGDREAADETNDDCQNALQNELSALLAIYLNVGYRSLHIQSSASQQVREHSQETLPCPDQKAFVRMPDRDRRGP